jgi:hypothetical protein
MQNAGPPSGSQFPALRAMPRVEQDIERILLFISRQPWGKPVDRERDIFQGIAQILARPRGNKVCIRRRATGVDLRRHTIAQFAIIYVYVEPNDEYPGGLVSLRAVRHRRVENVFSGVRERAPYGFGESPPGLF